MRKFNIPRRRCSSIFTQPTAPVYNALRGYADARTLVMDQFGMDSFSLRPSCRTKSLARIREWVGAANTVGWSDRDRGILRQRRRRVPAFGGRRAGVSRSGATSTVRAAPLVRPHSNMAQAALCIERGRSNKPARRTVDVEHVLESPWHLPPKEAAHLRALLKDVAIRIGPGSCVRIASRFPYSN